MLDIILFPPGLHLLVLAIGLLFHHWHIWTGRLIIAAGLISLYLMALPAIGNRQLMLLHNNTQFVVPEQNFSSQKTAIVVLGNYKSIIAPEYNDEFTPDPDLLARLRYAHILSKQLSLPILVCGGVSQTSATPEAVLMNQILVEDYQNEVQFIEASSKNLLEQAQNVGKIFTDNQLNAMILITHATEMKRARKLMSEQGIEVYPAAIGFVQKHPRYAHFFTPFIPTLSALNMTVSALKERLEYWWLPEH